MHAIASREKGRAHNPGLAIESTRWSNVIAEQARSNALFSTPPDRATRKSDNSGVARPAPETPQNRCGFDSPRSPLVSASPEQSPVPRKSADELWENDSRPAARGRQVLCRLTWLDRMRALEVKERRRSVLGVPDRFFRDWVDDHYRAAARGGAGPGRRRARSGRLRGGGHGASAGARQLRSARTVKSAAPRPPRLNDALHLRDLRRGRLEPAARRGGRTPSPRAPAAPTTRSSSTAAPAWARRTCSTRWATGSWRTNPAARIVYLSSEEFTNEFVESVRDHRMTEFRRKFRDECDVLLIDDIQFLGKQARRRRRSSSTRSTRSTRCRRPSSSPRDTVPAEIPGLEDRLRSRFTMGLITDIQEPNFETRVAILKKKAEAERLRPAGRRGHFIARHVQKNVRELEGALIKISRGAQPHRPADHRGVRRAGAARTSCPRSGRSTSTHIQREVARYYKVAVEELRAGPAAPSSSPTPGRWRCTCAASSPRARSRRSPRGSTRTTRRSSPRCGRWRSCARWTPASARELDELESKLGPG